jgi:hypothetical protein
MRWLFKLSIKLTLLGIIVALMAGGLWVGRHSIMRAAGIPEVEAPQFSSEESGLMATVLKSALQLFSGSKSRNELANGLSDKLYDGRMDAPGMHELGIELEKKRVEGRSAPREGASAAHSPPGGSLPAKQATRAGGSHADLIAGNGRAALAQLWEKAKVHPVELAVVPGVLLVLVVAMLRRRRRGRMDDFLPPSMVIQTPAESEPMAMTHAVHSLKAEEFELLVAFIYQRQGYRVSLPAGLGGERGIDFTLARKAERVLVQCRRLNLEHKVPVERVRELHEAVTAAGATRGIFVASCGFTWDARHFGKAKGVTLINARTLDALIDATQKADEDLLAVPEWALRFLSKAELTTPNCPTCGAKMDQLNVSDNSVWVCSQRPECRGRRSARKYHKPTPAAPRNTEMHANGVHA